MTQLDDGSVIECDVNEGCLEYWKLVEEKRAGDIPCYYSSWYPYPCYMGVRYGCSHYKELRVSWNTCWYEVPNTSKGYAWIGKFKPEIDDYSYKRCDSHEECFERAEEKIKNLGEDIIGLIVE